MVAALEAGVVPWVRPWSVAGMGDAWPCNPVSKTRYAGVNVLLLWLTAMERGYTDPRWVTFRQAKQLGGSVRKGEKATQVLLWRPYTKRVRDEDSGEEEDEKRLVVKHYSVFNVAQVDGLEGLEGDAEATELPEVDPSAGFDRAAALLERCGVNLTHGGFMAAYMPGTDRVVLPAPEQFNSVPDYWATALHELVHWTAHPSRLDRELGGQGTDAYAREELVAEMGSAFLCAALGVPYEELQHPAYLDHWVRVLKADSRALTLAATAARRASEMLLGFLEVDEDLDAEAEADATELAAK